MCVACSLIWIRPRHFTVFSMITYRLTTSRWMGSSKLPIRERTGSPESQPRFQNVRCSSIRTARRARRRRSGLGENNATLRSLSEKYVRFGSQAVSDLNLPYLVENSQSTNTTSQKSEDDYVWDIFYHRPGPHQQWTQTATVGTV